MFCQRERGLATVAAFGLESISRHALIKRSSVRRPAVSLGGCVVALLGPRISKLMLVLVIFGRRRI